MRVLMFCAVNRNRKEPMTRAEAAERAHVSPSHLAQVINQLAQLGYLETQRGRGGGIALACDPSRIVIGDVFRALEPEFPDTGCFADADDSCPLHDACRLRPALEGAAAAFYAHLDRVSLASLVCENHGLAGIFRAPCSVAGNARVTEPAACR